MARLMALCTERMVRGAPVADRILDWPGDPSNAADPVPLRFVGGVHALARAGPPDLRPVYPPNPSEDDDLWAAVAGAIDEEAGALLRWLDTPPQTNEVHRAAALIPALHLLAVRFGLPITLAELGTSGGLSMRADLLHLTAGPVTYGDSASGVQLASA